MHMSKVGHLWKQLVIVFSVPPRKKKYVLSCSAEKSLSYVLLGALFCFLQYYGVRMLADIPCM